MIDSTITHIRPRFELNVSQRKADLLDKFKKEVALHKEVKSKIIDNHIILDVVESERHFWSPHLSARVEIDESNPDNSVILGLIGPQPTVWTLFMFIYFSIGFAGFVISSYGVSKWMMGEFSHAIWAFPIAILIMLTAYKAGKVGEKLGADQTEQLKQIIRNVIRS